MVGSPHYMSPEILNSEDVNGYGPEVDWWSLGCIFFELITGSPPFVGNSPEQVFESIIKWKESLPEILDFYKDHISPVCMDFILLFISEEKQRSSLEDIDNLFKHPFFQGFQLNSIEKVEPPFVPKLENELDTCYFDDFEVPMKKNISIQQLFNSNKNQTKINQNFDSKHLSNENYDPSINIQNQLEDLNQQYFHTPCSDRNYFTNQKSILGFTFQRIHSHRSTIKNDPFSVEILHRSDSENFIENSPTRLQYKK